MGVGCHLLRNNKSSQIILFKTLRLQIVTYKPTFLQHIDGGVWKPSGSSLKIRRERLAGRNLPPTCFDNNSKNKNRGWSKGIQYSRLGFVYFFFCRLYDIQFTVADLFAPEAFLIR